MAKYNVNNNEESKQFVCVDRNDFYYIFNQKSILDFSIITDTHTVDLPEFSQRYNEASVQEKAVLNINKIVEALNMRDYSYVYNKFSDGFKKNYFKTEKDFTNFAKKYFKNNNKVEFNEFTQESNNTYAYNITLKDKKEKSTLELNTDIFMRFNEGTDFVITFSGVNKEIRFNREY